MSSVKFRANSSGQSDYRSFWRLGIPTVRVDPAAAEIERMHDPA
jgi:hypothetical protein